MTSGFGPIGSKVGRLHTQEGVEILQALPRRDFVLGGASAIPLSMAAASDNEGGASPREDLRPQYSPVALAAEPRPRFLLALNTGSILGYKLDVMAQVKLAAEAGYEGIELWIRDLEQFVEGGGRVEDLRKCLDDHGLKLVGAINFNAWAADGDVQREAALEIFRRDMEWVATLGGSAIAAAPAGIYQAPPLDLHRIAERYRYLLELGENFGVVPQLEIWGGSTNLRRVSEALFVAAEAAHPQAQLLLDVFHMYKGGSSPEALRLVNGATMTNFHINDYPHEPDRKSIRDSHRIFPGDGVAPLTRMLRTLWESGFRGSLALELFNQDYWKRPAAEMVREGLAKMKAAVEKAFENYSPSIGV